MLQVPRSGLSESLGVVLVGGAVASLIITLDAWSLARGPRLAGLKGYVTNISARVMPAAEVIASYHNLWHVEQWGIAASERMALADVKSRLSEVVDQIEREHGRVVITKHGRPAVVVLSIDDIESLEETLEVLSNDSLVADIREALAERTHTPPQTVSKDEALALLRRR